MQTNTLTLRDIKLIEPSPKEGEDLVMPPIKQNKSPNFGLLLPHRMPTAAARKFDVPELLVGDAVALS